MACAFIGLVAALLGLGAAKISEDGKKGEAEYNLKKRTKSNPVLQHEYEKQITRAVFNREVQYIEAGFTKNEYLPKLYQDFNIPMKAEISDKTTRDLIVRYDGVSKLIEMMTRRQMYSIGYAYSYDGHESNWQIDELKQQQREDTKRKYPWIL